MTNDERSEPDLDLDELVPTASLVLAGQLAEIRQRLGLSAEAFAKRAREVGLKFDRGTVSKIENGQRGISLDEALAIAVALDVAPVHLFLPRDDPAQILVAPGVQIPAVVARKWLRGRATLPDGDDQIYRTEVPKSEWEQGNTRVWKAEDEEERCARRYRIAKERMDLIADRLAELDEKIANETTEQRWQRRMAGRSFLDIPASTPAEEERSRLARMHDTALEAVAEAKIDLQDAQHQLRQARIEAGDPS